MDTRREFLKKMTMLSGMAGMASLQPSILRALAIDPEAGSTYLDAEHIILLMQENRSFDHALGTLRGIRGFNDPRAITLPDQNKVWLQKNSAGEVFAPFRLDIKDTKITWMGSLPHSRQSQMGARNNGRHDNWIEAKKSGDDDYKDMPITMGHYTREDIPFYYAMADAFTVCDQNFCSSLTPTDPNRLYFWSGTVRPEKKAEAQAYVDNDDIESGVEWPTFPELLEQHAVSWRIYQNELSVDGGFTGEENSWLANFGDNPTEFFKQYHVELSRRHIDYLPVRIRKLQQETEDLKSRIPSLTAGSAELEKAQKHLKRMEDSLKTAEEDLKNCTVEEFDGLPEFTKTIHQKAFSVNSGDPHQHELTPLEYTEGATDRKINIPKGDVLHRFRDDVQSGQLPTISWLVPPEAFSDHPSSPWFGSWFVSEVMDILTKNPETWKKTILILTYDENDGYYDHVPPFTAPDPRVPSSGKVSEGIDTNLEMVNLEKDVTGSIGLGFRVPMIIASPWSRGGYVNSQVFDHTSTLQFIEHFLNRKFGKDITETNITDWRRTVCGDLSSIFRQYNGERITGLPFIEKNPFIEGIYNAKFRNVPSNYKALTESEIEQINHAPASSAYMPQQEKGIRPACALPYELFADGNYDAANKQFTITLGAGNKFFKEHAAGAPFIVYARNYGQRDFKDFNYAVKAGDQLQDAWPVNGFGNNQYHLQVYGPNGFFREFEGNVHDPMIAVSVRHLVNGNAEISFTNKSSKDYPVEISDKTYHNHPVTKHIKANSTITVIPFDLSKSFGWYDLGISLSGVSLFSKRFAGRVETGKESKSDPAFG
ncbi:MAG: phospholipase C, phosphocholine-specific [Bacteroidota bacterium]|nr:phospholipase C, phosphocholine-specific [Bacteroidota bacterium]